MMWLKGCPKCRGDLFEEPAIGARSQAFNTVTCLQCGYQLSDQEERRMRAVQGQQRAAPRPRVA